MTHATIGIIGGSGLYDMAELTEREERTLTTPFGDPSGPYILGTLRGRRVAFLAPPRRRPPAAAIGAELSRQHLRLQGPRRRAPPVGQRGREPETGIPAPRHRRAGSVLRPDEGAHVHLLRARAGGARWLRPPGLRRVSGDCRRCGGGRGRDGPSGRDVREHGRAAVLDTGGVAARIVRGAWTSSA